MIMSCLDDNFRIDFNYHYRYFIFEIVTFLDNNLTIVDDCTKWFMLIKICFPFKHTHTHRVSRIGKLLFLLIFSTPSRVHDFPLFFQFSDIDTVWVMNNTQKILFIIHRQNRIEWNKAAISVYQLMCLWHVWEFRKIFFFHNNHLKCIHISKQKTTIFTNHSCFYRFVLFYFCLFLFYRK